MDGVHKSILETGHEEALPENPKLNQIIQLDVRGQTDSFGRSQLLVVHPIDEMMKDTWRNILKAESLRSAFDELSIESRGEVGRLDAEMGFMDDELVLLDGFVFGGFDDHYD
jgi:hypothetical protein